MGQWGIAAFLLVSTYFAGENGYEMILTHIGGPAEFVGDLVLIVPGTLIIGLGFATVARLVSQAKVEERSGRRHDSPVGVGGHAPAGGRSGAV